MAGERITTSHVYRLKVKNLDETRPVSVVVEEIERLAPEIAEELSNDTDKLQLVVKREESIPLDPVTIIILIQIINLTAKPVLEGFFKRLGEKLADSLTDKVDNATITNSQPDNESRG